MFGLYTNFEVVCNITTHFYLCHIEVHGFIMLWYCILYFSTRHYNRKVILDLFVTNTPFIMFFFLPKQQRLEAAY